MTGQGTRAGADGLLSSFPAQGSTSDGDSWRLPDATATTVLLIENHTVLAATLAEVLRSHGYHAVVVDTSRLDQESLLAAVDGERVAASRTIALVDLNISRDLDGVELIGPLRGRGVSVAVLSGVRDRLRLAEAVAAGAQALIDKADPLDILLWTVCRLEAGETAFPVQSREDLLSELEAHRHRNQASLVALRRLTRREAAILQRLSQGMTAEEIAATEFVSLNTVRSQVRAVLLKLGVHSQHDAIQVVRETRWDVDGRPRLRQGMRPDPEEPWPRLRPPQPGGGSQPARRLGPHGGDIGVPSASVLGAAGDRAACQQRGEGHDADGRYRADPEGYEP